MSGVIYSLKIKNHQTKQCFGLWLKLLPLVISSKRCLNKGDGFGAVHILSYGRSLSFPVVLLSNVSAVVSPVRSSGGKFHGCFCCRKNKAKIRHCFICLGDFTNAFYLYGWGRWCFSSDCFLGLQKDDDGASNCTCHHLYDFFQRSPP